ncbi:hypothetical protein imdm_318 [gamma proteobacterium IMCC2047]|nr:hypothetical protein imdm_318 [gamma proteobacterium IMCC2047]
MHHLDDIRAFQQFNQRPEIGNWQWINQKTSILSGNLKQRRLRIKGVNPHKLGIKSNTGAIGPMAGRLLQLCVTGDVGKGIVMLRQRGLSSVI